MRDYDRLAAAGLIVVLVAVLGIATLIDMKDVVEAAPDLTIEPLTWNVIGLDSNDPVNGPRHFPVAARVCSPTGTGVNPVTVDFVWDDADATHIYVRPGSSASLTFPALAPGGCVDAYFEVEVNPIAASYEKTRAYHIEATSGPDTVETIRPRELYVEHLISQNRNATTNMWFGTSLADLTAVAPGGSMNLLVGETYYIRLEGGTATQGYEQFEQFITLTNTIFQINSVETDYAVNSSPYVSDPDDQLYADACLWENDPNSPNYRACLDAGYKTGGAPVYVTYNVTILSVGDGSPQALNSLLYDFSGSSFHYNADFNASVRWANIIDPADGGISKRFVPDTINPNGVSTLVITLTNPNAGELSGYNFTDPLPAGVEVASPPNASTSGCGTPTFPPGATDTTLFFSDGTVAGNASCTISVDVTVASTGTYNNTTNNLFIGTIDTGNSASDTLTVVDTPLPPACTSGFPLATWAFPSASTPAGPIAPETSTVTASATAGAGLSPYMDSDRTGVDALSGSWTSDSIDDTGPLDTGLNQYFEFSLDTTGLTEVDIQYYGQRTPQGPQSLQIIYGATGTETTVSADALPTTAWTGFASNLATGINASGTTLFRIYVYNAGNNNNGHAISLDDVTFAGCAVPDPPTIAKGFNPDPVAVGAETTITFTLGNPNPIALTNAMFTDDLPAGMQVALTPNASTTCTGTPVWNPLTGATSLSFSGGTIPANGSCTVQVDVATSAAGTSTNITGFISSAESGQNTGPGGSASDTLTAVLPPQMTKVFSPNPIIEGGVSTLTFNITNPNQAVGISGVAFSDTYPAGLANATPASGSTTCTGSAVTAADGGNSVSLAGASIPASSSCTVTVNVTAAVAGNYPNLSGNVSHIINGNPENGNAATDTLTVTTPNPAIAILKQVGASATGPWYNYLAVAEGADVYYRITIENAGDVPLSPVSVSDPDVSLASCTWPASLPVADASDDDHIAICVVGPVTAVAGTNPNTATASGTYGGTPYTDDDSAIYATTELTLVKSASPTTFTTDGVVITYTFTVTNTGSAILSGPVTISDALVPGATCAALSTVGNLNNFFDPAEVVACTGTYTTTPADVTAGSITNTASASSGGVTSNTDTETVYVPEADLSVTKDDGSATYTPGGTVSYTIVVANAGPSPADGATFTDDLPEPPLSNINWTCGSEVGGAVCPTASGTGDISETVATFPAGGSLTYTVTADIAASATGDLINTATVTAPASAPDPDTSDNTATDTDTAAPQADLAVTKTDGSATYLPGGSVTYVIVVSNNGPSDANGATITDDLPEPPLSTINWTCGTETGGAVCPNASGTGDISETIATFPAGGSLTYTVTADIAASATGNLVNTVSVAPPVGVADPALGDNSTTDTDTAVPEADLAVTKDDGSATYLPGGSVTYTLVVTNNGPSDADGTVITDDLPEPPLSNINWTCGSETGGAVCPTASGTGDISETIATFPASSSLTYTVTADIDVSATGDLVNTASVAPPAGTTDPNDTNDAATDTDTNNPQADLSVTKDDSSTTYAPGGSVTYTIVVSNAGPSAANGATITDDLPEPPLSNINWTCGSETGGAVCPNTAGTGDISETIATFPASSSLTYTVTADIDVSATGDLVNTASVAPPAGITDPDDTDNAATDTDQLHGLEAAKSDALTGDNDGNGVVSAGDILTYTVIIENTGGADLVDLVFTDTPGANLTLVVGSVTVSDPAALVTQDTSVTVQIPLLQAGQSVTIAFDVIISDPLPDGTQTVSNQGLVSGPGVPGEPTDDPDTGDDDDPTETAIGEEPVDSPTPTPEFTYFDPSISKVGVLQDGGLGLPGERLAWIVTITNIGTGAGYDIVITDDIQPELRIDGAEIDRGTATIVGQTVTFYIPFLNPGESVQARIFTTVLASPHDGQFENTAYGEGVGPNNVVETASGSGTVPAATGLPSTGYGPSDDEGQAQSSVPGWILMAAAIVGVCLLFGSIWTVRMRRA